MINNHTKSLKKVINYFNTKESLWGYSLLLKGTKHFGYYPKGEEKISMAEAQRLMEDKLAEKLDLQKDTLVLDAGCGEGNVAAYLAKKYGYRIKGIDLLNFAIKKAKTKTNKLGLDARIDFQVGDYTYLNFSDKTFDGIYTMETLVHVPNYKKALSEFYRVLKPNGKLVLFEYSICPMEKLTKEQQRIEKMIIEESGMHSLSYFLHGKFLSILQQAGFKNISVEDITLKVMPMFKRFYNCIYTIYIY